MKHKLQLGLLLILLALAACAAPVTPTAPPTTPATPTPAPSATPAFTPTAAATATIMPSATPQPILRPVEGWNVPAQEVNSDLTRYFLRWQDNKSITTGSAGDLDVDTQSLVAPTSTPIVENNFTRVAFSQNQEFYVECVDQDFLQLHDVSTKQILWKKESKELECYFVAWAENTTRMAFIMRESAEGRPSAFVWSVGDLEPKIVAENLLYESFPSWAPDGDKFVVYESAKNQNGTYEAGSYTFRTIYADGRPSVLAETQLSTNNGGESINWITDDVFTNSHGCGGDCSFEVLVNANTGREIGGQIANYECGGQSLELSPNSYWLVLEDAFYDWVGLVETPCSYNYELLDLRSQQTNQLLKSQTTIFTYLGWSPDSSTFYTISRPVSETAQASADVPFGLLALNPQTRAFTQLFEQAVFAQLSPDQTRAWVVFPAKREDGTLGLDGGVFDLAAGTLAARQYVADKVFYGNPVDGVLLPIAWNHAGTRLVFVDAKGELTLVNVNGETQTLTASLPTGDGWRRETRLEWSPNDVRLLVQSGERAWVVEVP